MSKLINAIEDETNVALTENGAISKRTTKSEVLDLFARGGALRTSSEHEICQIFSRALAEDELLAMKCLFYLRDIRGGQGERRTFRVIINFLAKNHPAVLRKNLHLVSEYGRWDDLLCLLDTKLEGVILQMLTDKLQEDIGADYPSLLAKWLPSINTSSADSRRYAHKIREFLGWDNKTYRKTLSELRKKIDVIERKLCANEWDKINYENVPSRASLIYSNAFRKHDPVRYNEYISAVAKGEKKINASTLYPHDIVERVWNTDSDSTMDALWNALPDYCADNPASRGIVVADVSASMSGMPIQVSIALAIYFAERNEGIFKDNFITFSHNPTLQKVMGHDIAAKVRNLNNADWDMNTDLQRVFDLILGTACENKIPKSEMPDAIYIISDMQFDQACIQNSESNFEAIERKYKAAGYKRPKLVFWNVRAANEEIPVTKDQIDTVLVSGCSPTIFKTVMNGTTPYEVMVSTLNQDRYKAITV